MLMDEYFSAMKNVLTKAENTQAGNDSCSCR